MGVEWLGLLPLNKKVVWSIFTLATCGFTYFSKETGKINNSPQKETNK